jgi:hypothetical protein
MYNGMNYGRTASSTLTRRASMPKGTENTAKTTINQKLLPLYKKAAVTNIISIMRLFLEENLDFTGYVNVPIISLRKEDFKNVDNDQLQRLTLKMYYLEVLSQQNVRDRAERATLKAYANRISSIKVEIEISNEEDCCLGNAHAHVEIILPERSQA